MTRFIAEHWERTARYVWLGYATFLFTMTHIPLPQRVAQATSTCDKSIHFVAFGLLAVLTVMAYRKIGTLFTICTLAIYCALDEVLQGLVGRHPDIWDWYYDVGGVVTGVLMTHFVLMLLIEKPNWLRMSRSLSVTE